MYMLMYHHGRPYRTATTRQRPHDRGRTSSDPRESRAHREAIAEVRTEEGQLCLLVAIDRVSTFAYAERQMDAHKTIAAQFLRHLITAVPDKIHTVLTDNGI